MPEYDLLITRYYRKHDEIDKKVKKLCNLIKVDCFHLLQDEAVADYYDKTLLDFEPFMDKNEEE